MGIGRCSLFTATVQQAMLYPFDFFMPTLLRSLFTTPVCPTHGYCTMWRY